MCDFINTYITLQFDLLQGPFVAAFASTNLGDVSPNIKGPRCQKSGVECDMNTSKCPSNTEFCVASGPGNDIFESTKIIAENLYSKAGVSEPRIFYADFILL